MCSNGAYSRLDLLEDMRSGPDFNEGAHIYEKRHKIIAEPNWRKQLQYAEEGVRDRLLQYHQDHVQDVLSDEQVNIDDDALIDEVQLPRKPTGVGKDLMRLPLWSTAASPGRDKYRMLRLPNPADLQIYGAIPSAHGPMAPRAPPTPSQNVSSTLMDTATLITPTIFQNLAALNRLGRHDYDFQSQTRGYTHELNFTAVEIIAFLPTLFCNSSIARRLVNNGMENTTHSEISDHHRVSTLQVDVIGKAYLDALRPADWRQMTKETTKTLWSRKKQKIPEGWDARCISMNSFVPDRIAKEGVRAPAPASVPFSALLEGLKKIPTGNDAADLTRAVEFATGDEAKKTFPNQDLMFPDDLIDILKTIGHTMVTEQHRDMAVVSRYRRLSKEKAKLRKASSPESNGTSSIDLPQPPSRQDSIRFALSEGSPAPPESYHQTSPPTSPPKADINLPFVSSQATQDLHHVASSQQVPAPGSPRTPASPSELSEHTQLARHNRLLRNVELHSISGSLLTIETSQVASAILYACRPDQNSIDWHATPEHVADINSILEDKLELAKNPSQEHIDWERNWEQHEGERQREFDDSTSALQHKYGVQVKAHRSFTVEDYEDLFDEPAPEYLKDIGDPTEPFDTSSGDSTTVIDPGELD